MAHCSHATSCGDDSQQCQTTEVEEHCKESGLVVLNDVDFLKISPAAKQDSLMPFKDFFQAHIFQNNWRSEPVNLQ